MSAIDELRAFYCSHCDQVFKSDGGTFTYHRVPECKGKLTMLYPEPIITAQEQRLGELRAESFTAKVNGLYAECVYYTDHKRIIAAQEQRIGELSKALHAYADGDDCGCADGSPDQPLRTGQCPYCKAQTALENSKPAEGTWQPIETAPRNGMPLLLCWPQWDTLPTIGSYSKDRERWALNDQEFYDKSQPTHWMPLPEPPAD